MRVGRSTCWYIAFPSGVDSQIHSPRVHNTRLVCSSPRLPREQLIPSHHGMPHKCMVTTDYTCIHKGSWMDSIVYLWKRAISGIGSHPVSSLDSSSHWLDRQPLHDSCGRRVGLIMTQPGGPHPLTGGENILAGPFR